MIDASKARRTVKNWSKCFSGRIVRNHRPVAKQLADAAELVQCEVDHPNNILIEQGSSENDLFLIITGKVSITINGREVAVRQSGQHVGEMAMLDASAP